MCNNLTGDDAFNFVQLMATAYRLLLAFDETLSKTMGSNKTLGSLFHDSYLFAGTCLVIKAYTTSYHFMVYKVRSKSYEIQGLFGK